MITIDNLIIILIIIIALAIILGFLVNIIYEAITGNIKIEWRKENDK
jgi:hypothetical protein